MSEASAIKPAYLISGTDEAKLGTTLARLRARAEREGGTAALESFDPTDGAGPPDAEALIATLPAMSLLPSRRYLLADHVERWSKKQTDAVAQALELADPDTVVVLVAHERAPKALADAVKKRKGELLSYEAPKRRELPAWLSEEAKTRGFRLDRDAARVLIERLGESTARLASELDRLALWAEPGGSVAAEDLRRMVADTSEEMIWTLSDAITARHEGAGLTAAERLLTQGESVSYIVYSAAGRLRRGISALAQLEAGRPSKDVERNLGMSPYAAKMLLRSVREASSIELQASLCAVADLEWWSRGGSDYDDPAALALAVRTAVGAR